MNTNSSMELTITERFNDWPLPSLDALTDLCDFEGPCITICLAEHLPGAESKSTQLHLRARIEAAAVLLRDHSAMEGDIQALLAPLKELADLPDLHGGHQEGLAIFRSPQTLQFFRLPQYHRNAMYVEERFHVVPILQHLFLHPDFYLMKLSRKGFSLTHVDMSTSRPVEVPESVVCDYELFKSLDQPDHLLRARSGVGTGSGSRSPVSFGTSSDREKETDHFHDFCKAIERGLYPMLVAKAEALVVAGTQTEVAAYRKANRFQLLLKDGVYGSPEGGASHAEMVESARKLLRGWKTPEELRILKLYKDLEGTAKALVEMNAIVEAAAQGRVENLVIADGVEAIGNYDFITNRRLLSGSFEARRVDLVNAAAVDTLRHGGKVVSPGAQADTIPTAVGAVLRF